MKDHRKLSVTKVSSWPQVYHLREGDLDIATFALHNPHGSRARATGDGFDITLHRTKFFPKEIQLQTRGRGSPHTFRAQWNSKGWLDFLGKKYRWLPGNRIWTVWIWENENREELMRIQFNPFHPFSAHGRIFAHPELSREELAYLGLLGWYLLLLDFELAGSRVLSAIELGLRRFKKAVPAVS